MAAALGERGINITAIVGIAEDTDGALMLTTSDAAGTRKAFEALNSRLRRNTIPMQASAWTRCHGRPAWPIAA